MREFVALDIQHATRTRHIAICGLSDCAVFCHIITKTARFSGGKFTEYKMCDN